MRTHISPAVTTVALAVAVAVGIVFIRSESAKAAWVDPISPPPLGNVAAPINVSTVPQTKSGNLTIGGSALTVSTGDFFFPNPTNQGVFWTNVEDLNPSQSPHIEYASNKLYVSPGVSGSGVEIQGNLIVQAGKQICFGTDCKTAWPVGGASGVSSIVVGGNSLTNNVTLQGAGPINVVNAGNTVTFSCPSCGGSSMWTQAGSLLYPSNNGWSLLVGGTTTNAPFVFSPSGSLAKFKTRLEVAGSFDTGVPLVQLTNNSNDEVLRVTKGASGKALVVQNSSGVAAKISHDMRIVAGDLIVLNEDYEGAAPYAWGVRLRNGDKADIESWCEDNPNIGGNACVGFSDALYIQNGSRNVFLSADTGEGGAAIGHIGIGTDAQDNTYKLTVGSGNVANTALLRGRVDIKNENPTNPGSLTVENNVQVGGELRINDGSKICLRGVCIDDWADIP